MKIVNTFSNTCLGLSETDISNYTLKLNISKLTGIYRIILFPLGSAHFLLDLPDQNLQQTPKENVYQTKAYASHFPV